MEKDMKYYEDFAHKIFNYLNGKINSVVKTTSLRILQSDKMINFAGNTHNGIVEICISDIMQQYRGGVEVSIILVIAHELAHIDQVIDYKLKEVSYNDDIEAQANLFSTSYILQNYDAISDEINGDFDISYIEAIMEKAKTLIKTPYVKISLAKFYTTLLELSFNLDFIEKDFTRFETVLFINDITDTEFIIKRHNILNSDTGTFIEIFNILYPFTLVLSTANYEDDDIPSLIIFIKPVVEV